MVILLAFWKCKAYAGLFWVYYPVFVITEGK